MACAACSSTTRCSKSKSISRRATFLKFHHVTMQKGLRGLALLKFVCSVRAPGTSMDQCTGKDAGSERPRLHSIRKEKLQALHTKLQPCMGIRNFFEQKHVRFLKKPCTKLAGLHSSRSWSCLCCPARTCHTQTILKTLKER